MLLNETQTTICNKALMLIGEEPITSIDDNTLQAKVCKEHYYLSLRATLESGHWPFAIVEEPITRIDLPAYTKEQKFVYRIPGNCAVILSITKRYNRKQLKKHIDWDIRYIPELKTSAIICNALSRKMDESDTKVPDIYEDEQMLIEYVADSQSVFSFSAAFIKCVVAQLAVDICMAITHDTARFTSLYQYAAMLRQQALTQALNEDKQDKGGWMDHITASRERYS